MLVSPSLLTARSSRLRRDERGFTLIEVMVAMVVGLVVIGALFAILEVSLKQTARLTDRVQSQQLGSGAMAKIIDPMRSGCISREATPVMEGSTPSKLIFTTAFSESTTPEPKEVFKETVEYSGHKLTSTTQPASSGSWPNYTFSGSSTKAVIAENVYMPSGREGPFRYFKYTTEDAKAASTSSTASISALEAFTTTGALSEKEAEKVASVEVAFEALPSDSDTRLNRASQFSDQVTFAFSSPNSEATIKAGPCE